MKKPKRSSYPVDGLIRALGIVHDWLVSEKQQMTGAHQAISASDDINKLRKPTERDEDIHTILKG